MNNHPQLLWLWLIGAPLVGAIIDLINTRAAMRRGTPAVPAR